jgi:hypothetical protein
MSISKRFHVGCVVLLTSLISAVAVAGGWENSLKPQGESGPNLTLASNGATDYVIVIPEKPTTQDQKAAQDLAQWLREMTGAQFPIVADSSALIPTEISIGRTNRLAQANLPEAGAELGDEGYAIATLDKRMFLTGGRKRGPINAVYALLEEDLGCRWYAGSEARIPKQPTLQFNPVVRRFVPTLRIRDPYYTDAFDAAWSLRNRTNAPCGGVSEEWGGHMDYDGLFVHTYAGLVPSDKYFKSNVVHLGLLRKLQPLSGPHAEHARAQAERRLLPRPSRERDHVPGGGPRPRRAVVDAVVGHGETSLGSIPGCRDPDRGFRARILRGRCRTDFGILRFA